MNWLARRVHRSAASRRVGKLVDGNKEEKLTRLGTSDGGWTVPTAVLEPGTTAVCIGAGEDISFDVELNKRQLNVVTLDPTPRAKTHVQKVLAGVESGEQIGIGDSKTEFYDLKGFDAKRFAFSDLGVWSEEKIARFYSPRDKGHVSHSIANLQKTEEYFEARCVTLKNFCESQKLTNLRLVKMDIEGAEYEVVKNLMKEGPQPEVLCVEFDEIRNPLDAKYLERIQEVILLLKENGYCFAELDRSNALFVKRGRAGNLG